MRIEANEHFDMVVEVEDTDREIVIKHKDFMYPKIYITTTVNPDAPLRVRIFDFIDGKRVER